MIRHRDRPTGRDLHRRDRPVPRPRRRRAHAGDEPAIDLDPRYGPRPPWHDVQLEVHGPAVGDLAWTFRERWENPTPLDHRNPWRALLRRRAREPRRPQPLPPMPADPGPARRRAVQVLRTYPAKRPPHSFASVGERSIARAYLKAFERHGSWCTWKTSTFGRARRRGFPAARGCAPAGLRLVAVVPRYPDRDSRSPTSLPDRPAAGHRSAPPSRRRSGHRVRSRGRIGLAHLRPLEGLHRGRRMDDGRQRHLNIRSWTNDSELSCVVIDERRTSATRPTPAASATRSCPGARDAPAPVVRAPRPAMSATTPTSSTASPASRRCAERPPTSTPGTQGAAPAHDRWVDCGPTGRTPWSGGPVVGGAAPPPAGRSRRPAQVVTARRHLLTSRSMTERRSAARARAVAADGDAAARVASSGWRPMRSWPSCRADRRRRPRATGAFHLRSVRTPQQVGLSHAWWSMVQRLAESRPSTMPALRSMAVSPSTAAAPAGSGGRPRGCGAVVDRRRLRL